MYTKVVNWSEEEAKEFNGEDVVEWTWCGHNWTPICKKKKKEKKKVSSAIDLMDPKHNAKCKTIKVLTKHTR